MNKIGKQKPVHQKSVMTVSWTSLLEMTCRPREEPRPGGKSGIGEVEGAMEILSLYQHGDGQLTLLPDRLHLLVHQFLDVICHLIQDVSEGNKVWINLFGDLT